MQEKKLKGNAAFAARKQKPVTRNPLKNKTKKTHSAKSVVHNDVNIADSTKLFVHMFLKLQRKNAITACSRTLQTIVTTTLVS